MIIDLQLHSTYSDGFFTPTQLAKFIAKRGIEIASLTDHHTVSGQKEFRIACREQGLKAVTGVEIYARLNQKTFNLLWYNFDDNGAGLHDLLRKTQIRRRCRVRQILESLQRDGFKLEVEKILDKYTHYVPVNKVAGDFYAHPYNHQRVQRELKTRNVREEDILNHYFFNPKYGVLSETHIDINKILELRKKIGGKLIFCHPGKHNKYAGGLSQKLKKIGVDGIEVLSPHHSIRAVMYSQYLAKELDWIATGGSDFHLLEGKNLLLQHSGQWFSIESKYLRKINEILKYAI